MGSNKRKIIYYFVIIISLFLFTNNVYADTYNLSSLSFKMCYRNGDGSNATCTAYKNFGDYFLPTSNGYTYIYRYMVEGYVKPNSEGETRFTSGQYIATVQMFGVPWDGQFTSTNDLKVSLKYIDQEYEYFETLDSNAIRIIGGNFDGNFRTVYISFTLPSNVLDYYGVQIFIDDARDNYGFLNATGGGANYGITAFSLQNYSTELVEMIKANAKNDAIINQNQTIINQNNKTNEELAETNDTLKDSDSSGATDSAGNFFSGFTTDTFGLTSIITAPINLIKSITSSTCSPMGVPVPFVDTTLNLPCLSSIYRDYFGSFLDVYQTITFGIVGYWVCVRIFALVKDFKNPEHDEIEVLDL